MDFSVIQHGLWKAEISRFDGDGSRGEVHAIVHVSNNGDEFAAQAETAHNAMHRVLDETGGTMVFIRIFLSDAVNQMDTIRRVFVDDFNECAVSVVQQTPLDGSKIALWIYAQKGVRSITRTSAASIAVDGGASVHLWGGSQVCCQPDSEEETRSLLQDYAKELARNGATLEDNCIRTWFFVQNVDVNYAGLVKARNEVFLQHNLTEKTHYIASTGIGGAYCDPKVTVQMNTYAVKNIRPEQITFLYASEYMNPTYEYAVAFERGTAVDFADRREIFVSGTASINNRGEVVYVGDIGKQTDRMLENVDALLREAGAGFSDVAHMLVYLRDVSDYEAVRQMFRTRFPHTPVVILHAPVCRPAWLIEMECIAIKPQKTGFMGF